MGLNREKMPDGIQRVYDKLKEHHNFDRNSVTKMEDTSHSRDVYSLEFDLSTDIRGVEDMIQSINQEVDGYTIKMIRERSGRTTDCVHVLVSIEQ